MKTTNLCIVGDIVTDITLPQNDHGIKMRLGGITHAARSLWGLNTKYHVNYFAPEYIKNSAIKYLKHHGASKIIELGIVSGAPYLFLIGNVKETSDQLYEFILRDEIKINSHTQFNSSDYDDILIISGNFDLEPIISNISEKSKVHIDLSNNISEISQIDGFKYQTVFLSTSSEIFKKYYLGSFSEFCHLFEDMCNVLILKENRGGSRIYDFSTQTLYNIPSQTQPVVHSVGIGDAYDACFVAKYRELGVFKASILSAWVASEYALTTFVDDFKKNLIRILKTNIDELVDLGGCLIPWEDRPNYSIYIAAPDFDYLDTSKIDVLTEALRYHNFNPRRPIIENGQLTTTDNEDIRRKTFEKDINLIHTCSLLIAIYINEDPGTMIEIGYAKALGLPCLVFDPYNKAYNCMLTNLPDLVSSDLDHIISETFNQISRINDSKK